MDFFSKVNVELEGDLKSMSEWLNKLQFPDLAQFGFEQGSKDDYEQYFERMQAFPTPIVGEIQPHFNASETQRTLKEKESRDHQIDKITTHNFIASMINLDFGFVIILTHRIETNFSKLGIA